MDEDEQQRHMTVEDAITEIDAADH